VKYVQFDNPVTIAGLPPTLNSTFAAWDEHKHGKVLSCERDGSFIVLRVFATKETYFVPMHNVISMRMGTETAPAATPAKVKA
jgi:hypothetical protein